MVVGETCRSRGVIVLLVLLTRTRMTTTILERKVIDDDAGDVAVHKVTLRRGELRDREMQGGL